MNIRSKRRKLGLCVYCGGIPIQNKGFCLACSEKLKEKRRVFRQTAHYKSYYKRYQELHKIRLLQKSREYNKNHINEKRAYDKKRHKLEKEMALDAYGGRYCVCCGETDISVLTLDHINDDKLRRAHKELTDVLRELKQERLESKALVDMKTLERSVQELEALL
jgi:hypothetical protein